MSHEALGPRRTGGRYYSGYWAEEYTVLAVGADDFGGWSVTVATDDELKAGTSRTHCTAWDDDRDRVIRQPRITTLASPDLAGDKPVPTAARVAALDLVLDVLGTDLSPASADMVIDYAAKRLERGEVDGSIATLTSYFGYGNALRLIAAMETDGK